MKRVEGRKHFQGEGVRRENARKRRVFQPAPDVFERGAKSAICGGAEWAGFPRSCFGRGVPAPVGVYWVLLYGRSRAPPLRAVKTFCRRSLAEFAPAGANKV